MTCPLYADHWLGFSLQKEETSRTESESDDEVEDIFVIISDLKQDVAKYENQYKSSRVKGFKDSEYQEYLVMDSNKGQGKVFLIKFSFVSRVIGSLNFKTLRVTGGQQFRTT